MKVDLDAAGLRTVHSVQMYVLLTLVLTLFAPSTRAQAQAIGSIPADSKSNSGVYKTFYLSNNAEQDAQEIVTDLRNMLPRTKLYFVRSQNAISMLGTPEDFQLAQKILSDLDRTSKLYRLTYTIVVTDNGQRIGKQQVAVVVALGGKTVLKQGTRVPVVTGTTDTGTSTQGAQVAYLDIGLNIEASLDEAANNLRLRTKIVQSNVSAEKSSVGVQDPIIRQTTLEGISTLSQGKPLVLGSLDVPGSTQHQEVEVTSELVQ